MKYDLSNWPEVNLDQIRLSFREVPLAAYPELKGYSRSNIHEGLAGQGGLFLASDMAKLLGLRNGMRVLDLGCGAGTTAIYLARTYGVHVDAVDMNVPEALNQRAVSLGIGHLVSSTSADCTQLPFAEGYFDAVFSMNAFFYFGTGPAYPSYLLKFLKSDGELVIGSPCYAVELSEDSPEEFLLEYPACLKVHSPGWWRDHFAKHSTVLHSALHPLGALFWEDRVRFLLENENPRVMSPGKREMVYAMIRMLNRDTDGFVSHFILHAKKAGK